MQRQDRKRVVIVGASFAGLAAAHALRRRLGKAHDIVVISRSDEFIFSPSLVWVPFGVRDKRAISRLVRPELRAAGISFIHAPVSRFDLDAKQVFTAVGSERFDYLVLATGSIPNFDAVDGLGPRGGLTQSVSSWSDATLARMALETFADAPGPVVVGGVQGAACLDVAYEFLFAMILWLRKRGLSGQVPVTFLNPARRLGDVGHGDRGDHRVWATRLAELGVRTISGARVRRISPGVIELEDGRGSDFAYAMLMPGRVGATAVARCAEIVDADGRVLVDRLGQAPLPAVYAVGGAVAYASGGEVGPPSAAYLAEASAEVVANNIAASILGGDELAIPTLGGELADSEVTSFDLADKVLRENHWLFPGPEGRWATDVFSQRFNSRRIGEGGADQRGLAK